MNKLHSYYITDTTDLILKFIEKHGQNNATLSRNLISELNEYFTECEKIEDEEYGNECHEWQKWWRDIRYLCGAHRIVTDNWDRAEMRWKES